MSASAVATGSRRSGEAGAVSSEGFVQRFVQQFVERYCLGLGERADTQPAQSRDMTEAAAGAGQVARQAAHVDALAGSDLEHGVVQVGTVDQVEAVDPGGTGLQHRRAALAGHVVGALAGDLYRRRKPAGPA